MCGATVVAAHGTAMRAMGQAYSTPLQLLLVKRELKLQEVEWEETDTVPEAGG